jgi:hypothetical protein
MYMKRKPLRDEDYDRIVRKLGPKSRLRKILELATELRAVSSSVKPTELTSDERDALDNHGNSYPVFSLHFYSMDALRGLLDEEGNMVMQTTPIPHVILPFTLDNDVELEQAFTAMAGIAKVIAIAAAIVKDLPESD